MNSRERLRRCFYYEEMDRPAVYSRTCYPPNDPSYDRLRSYLGEHAELKAGWNGRSLDRVESRSESMTEPHSDKFERRITVVHTPAGDLKCSHLVSLTGAPGMHESFLLEGPDDGERYLSLPRPDYAGSVDSFYETEKHIGNRGITEVSLGANPAGTIAELFGSENFAVMTLTDRDLIHQLLQREMEIMLDRVKALLDTGVGPYFAILGQEYITPPLHGPIDFREFNVKYDKPIVELIKNSGGVVHVHCHGPVGSVLPDFVEMGINVLHPIEAPPMGDITAADAKQILRGKVAIDGNIQIDRLYSANPDQIREETEALINDAFDDHCGLCVCPTASPYIPDGGEQSFPQYEAMVDAVLNFVPQ